VLRLTKKADYGLIAVKHLAERVGSGVPQACSARDLAVEYSIPQEALAKILQRLTRKGLLISTQGANGGYILARSPAQISLLEVIRAIEGPLFITTCFTARVCEQSGSCTIREPLRKVNETLAGFLEKITIADVCDGAEAVLDKDLVRIAGTPHPLHAV